MAWPGRWGAGAAIARPARAKRAKNFIVVVRCGWVVVVCGGLERVGGGWMG